LTTRKGIIIQEKILYYLERNPDGLRIGVLQNLIEVSRNSIYRYLDILEMKGLIYKMSDKTWVLKEPLRPQTIPGYQYQAILEGIKDIGGSFWDIETTEGKKNFKELGKKIAPKMKLPDVDLDKLRQMAHYTPKILEYTQKLLQEMSTVERFNYESKLNDSGFPDPLTKLAGIITFEGGYIASDPVTANGFAHYYILAGAFEQVANKWISILYGGRTIVEVLKINEENQIVDLGVYTIFDKKTPYIDPRVILQ